MLRIRSFAAAAVAAALVFVVPAVPALAQAFDPSIARARPSVSLSAVGGPLDDARGRRVALWAASGAAANVDVAWTDGLASGTIRLDSESGGCRGFFLRQTSPASPTPLIGRVCRSGGAWEVREIASARAGGPSGEPRVTDGVRDVMREEAEVARKAEVERTAEVARKKETERARAEEALRRDRALREYEGVSGAKRDGYSSATKPMSTTSTGAPSSPSAPPMPPQPRISAPPAPGNATGDGSAAGGGVVRTMSAVLVEIGAREARKPRNGGSAVVLLSQRTEDAARNLRVCRALFRALDTATTSEITTGQRRTEDGGVEKLRPVYWLWKGKPAPPAGDACPVRVASYDFARAGSIRTKYGLTGRGPYLVVARGDELRAGVVDLGAAPIGDTEDLVRYFRDGFSQEDDIWSPERHTPARAQQSLVAFLGRAIPGAALTALVRPVAVASCPLGDFFDVCTPAPR